MDLELRGKKVLITGTSKRIGLACAQAGWSKRAVRDYVHQHCRVSAKRLLNKPRNTPAKIRPQWKWLLDVPGPEPERMMLPVLDTAHQYEIVVVGGPVGKNLLFRSISLPSIAVIKDRAAV